MYIADLAKFTGYIAGSRRTIEEVCKFLVLHTFSAYSPRAIFVGQVTSDGYLQKKCSFGFESSAVSQWERIPLSVNIPIIDSVRRDEVLLFMSREEMFSAYPAISNMGVVDEDWKSAFVFLRRNPELAMNWVGLFQLVYLFDCVDY